jgi:hypothetical protein
MAGAIARQMANAPKSETEPTPQPTGEQQPTAPAQPTNRFREMFSGILFSAASANAKVYPNTDGSATKKIANVRLEMARANGEGSRVYLKGSIRAFKAASAKKAVVLFGFFGAQNQGVCLATEDEAATLELAAFKRYIEAQYDAHRKANNIQSGPSDSGGIEVDVDM